MYFILTSFVYRVKYSIKRYLMLLLKMLVDGSHLHESSNVFVLNIILDMKHVCVTILDLFHIQL
jgi:hypothetical protein